MKGYLIEPRDVIANTPVRGSVDTDIIGAAIKRVQETDIIYSLGFALQKKLIEVSDLDIVPPSDQKYKDLLDAYVAPYVEWMVANALIYDISVKMASGGVIESSSEQGNAVFGGLTAILKNEIRTTSNKYKKLMIDFLRYENSKYPEYNQIEQGKPNRSGDAKPFNGVQFY